MKNLNAARSRARQTKLKYSNIKDILAVSSPVGQGDRHEKLTQSVQRRELTEIFETLSEYGFNGDLGIVAIRYIQDLGGQFDV